MAIDLVGKRVGRLLVRSFDGAREQSRWWKCECDCGSIKLLTTEVLNGGKTNSCGCLRRENTSRMFTKHGATKSNAWTAEYRAWVSMKTRCEYPEREDFKWYGSQGIKVCELWRDSFEKFLDHVGPRPTPKHSLDRINPWGNYEPGNVRWATASEQQKNKRGAAWKSVRAAIAGA